MRNRTIYHKASIILLIMVAIGKTIASDKQ